MMFLYKMKGSKLFTGSPTLHMRLPSLCMQALSLRYSTVWANRAGGQSTGQALVKNQSSGATASPVNHESLLLPFDNIPLNFIIQGVYGLLVLHRNLRPELTLLYTNLLLVCVKTNMRILRFLPMIEMTQMNELLPTA